jgi:CelD/BcsL family acetyltransferase involved in cellulose biosynthesis
MFLTIDVIEQLDGLRLLAEEWNRLASPFKTPLLRHEWFTACAEAFCPPGRLYVMVAREEGEIVAIAPLVLNPSFGARRLELLGTAILGELSGFVYKDEQSLTGLMNAILASRRPLLFRGLLSGSPELRCLKQAHPPRNYVQSEAFASPWVRVSTNWEKFYPTISSSWRSTLRRAQRRAEEFGPLHYEFVIPTPETLEQYLPEMFRVESAGWKSRTGTALQASAVLSRFFRAYALSAARLGMLQFAFLRIGGKTVAGQFLIACGGRLWVLKIGYDEAYARCSPGTLLMHRVVQYTFDKPYEALEFLGANEPWTGIWRPELHHHESYRRYPLSLLPVVSHGLEVSNGLLARARAIMKKEQGGTPWRVLVKKAVRRLHRPRLAAPQ